MQARAATSTSSHSDTKQLRAKTEQVKRDIRELGGVAREVAAEKFDHWYKEGREKAIQLERGLENRIRENPLQSVMIAAGAGFLAGFLVNRRR